MTCSSWLTGVSLKVTSVLEKGAGMYGVCVYKYPWVILIISIVVLACLTPGFSLYEEEGNSASLWAPKGAQALEDSEKIEHAFQIHSESEFLYVVGKPQGANLLTADAFSELIDFELKVWDSVAADGKQYNDICLKAIGDDTSNESACQTTHYPLLFFLKEDGTFDESMLSSLINEINDGKGTSDFFPMESSNYISIDRMFGGTVPIDAQSDSSTGTNHIQQAEALQWVFYLDTDGLSLDFIKEYEQKYEDFVYDQFNKDSQSISVHPVLNTSRARESAKALAQDFWLLTFGIAFIVGYSLFVVGELNMYRSRMLIGIGGIASVVIAYVEAIALGAYLGLQGNGVVSIVPFLMIGIGVDDMFVLISTLKRAPRGSSGQDMMEYMMKHAGVSITITSLTNFGSFAIGSMTSIPAIHNFCLYAAFGMFFDYFNQITFFVALLAYDIRRSERPLGDCCGLLFCKPGSKACCQGKYIVDEAGDPQEHLSRRFIYKVYSKFLMKTPVRILVCILFALLLGLNIYGVTQLTLEFNFDWFVYEGSRVHKSLEIRKEYFGTTGLSVGFYSLYSEFSTAEVQSQLETLAEKIENCSGCQSPWIMEGSTESWYTFFKSWVRQENCRDSSGNVIGLSDGYVPSEHFYNCLQQFEATDSGSLFSGDLAWEDGVLVGSRIGAVMVKINTSEETVQVLEDTRDLAKHGPDDTYVYNGAYPWYEQNAVFTREATIQLLSALSLIFVIILLTTADIWAGLIVLLMVGMTVIGQMATVYFWGEYLNIVTMVNSIMAIGISVDCSAHFVHAYKSLEGGDKKKKVRQSLRIIGVDIFDGGLSTFLAILPLLGSKTYEFRIFYKCWFPILLYGVAHALILLPVILSVIGATPLIAPEEDIPSHGKTGRTVESPELNSKEADIIQDREALQERNDSLEVFQVSQGLEESQSLEENESDNSSNGSE